MHYKPLTNDTKVNIELPDAAFQGSQVSQLVQLNRTRKILLFLTGIQFVSFLFIKLKNDIRGNKLILIGFFFINHFWYYLRISIWLCHGSRMVKSSCSTITNSILCMFSYWIIGC